MGFEGLELGRSSEGGEAEPLDVEGWDTSDGWGCSFRRYIFSEPVLRPTSTRSPIRGGKVILVSKPINKEAKRERNKTHHKLVWSLS